MIPPNGFQAGPKSVVMPTIYILCYRLLVVLRPSANVSCIFSTRTSATIY